MYRVAMRSAARHLGRRQLKLKLELVWKPEIVVIQERDPLAPCEVCANVPSLRDAAFGPVNETNARVCLSEPSTGCRCRRSGSGSAPHDDHLEVVEGLSKYALDRLDQQAWRRCGGMMMDTFGIRTAQC